MKNVSRESARHRHTGAGKSSKRGLTRRTNALFPLEQVHTTLGESSVGDSKEGRSIVTICIAKLAELRDQASFVLMPSFVLKPTLGFVKS